MAWDPPSPSGSGPFASPGPTERPATDSPWTSPGLPAPIIGTPQTFISYRRKHRTVVTRLDARLRDDLGTTNVYRDTEDLIVGEDFEARVFEQIHASDAVIVVVGTGWEAGAGSRLDEPHDFVRREVAAALTPDSPPAALPLLLDGATFPEPLPPELEGILRLHRLETTSDELLSPESPSYQGLLVGIWETKRRRTPHGVLVFGGESTVAYAAVENLVSEMKKRRLVDAVELTRYACNAQVLSRRTTRRLSKKYHDVIIVIDPDSAHSPDFLARLRAIARRRDLKVAVLAVGGTLTLIGDVARGEGGLSDLPAEVADVLRELRPTTLVDDVSKFVSWRATTSVATNAAVGGAGIGLATLAAILFWPPGPDPPDPIALAGRWDVEEFTVEQEGTDGSFRPIPGGTMAFEPVAADCVGSGCTVRVTAGPDFLVGTQVTPDAAGGFETEFAVDEEATIRSISGGVTCPADGADLTPSSALAFDAGMDETADRLTFAIVVSIPDSARCLAGEVRWSAEATRLPGG